MVNSRLARIGASLFVGWGLLHIVGGIYILAELAESPAAGFAVYRDSAGEYPALAGAILGYFSYLLVAISVAVIATALLYNMKNSKAGLAVNSAIILAVEIGLLIFLIVPGHVSFAEASVGFALALGGLILCGIACNLEHAKDTTRAPA